MESKDMLSDDKYYAIKSFIEEHESEINKAEEDTFYYLKELRKAFRLVGAGGGSPWLEPNEIKVRDHIINAMYSIIEEYEDNFAEWTQGIVRGATVDICSKCLCDSGTLYRYKVCPNCGRQMKNGD
jgi:hypothetical protein